MIIHDVGQGSVDWLHLRSGMPTASNFGKIITPEGKSSKQADDYCNFLIAEKLLGRPVEDFTGTKWTERGQDIETQAVHFYEFQKDVPTKEVGFITDDANSVGCSPDRLVGEDGILEIKCLKANTHIAMLLDQVHDPKHKPQIQGMLFITGRAWVDIEYFHPDMASMILRVARDWEFTALLEQYLSNFKNEMAYKIDRLSRLGYLTNK